MGEKWEENRWKIIGKQVKKSSFEYYLRQSMHKWKMGRKQWWKMGEKWEENRWKIIGKQVKKSRFEYYLRQSMHKWKMGRKQVENDREIGEKEQL